MMTKAKFQSFFNRKITISIGMSFIVSTALIVTLYSSAELYIDFSMYIFWRTILGIVIFTIIFSILIYTVYSIVESILKVKKGNADVETLFGLFFIWMFIVYFLLYDFQNFLEIKVFSNYGSNFPSFIEFIGIIASIFIPFILLQVSNKRNDKREEKRQSLEHQVLLSPKFKWS